MSEIPDWLAVAAVRYCTGRTSVVVGECCDWLLAHWQELSGNARHVIARDLEREFEADDKARQDGERYKPLGWDCDRREWDRVRTLWGDTSNEERL